MSKGLGREPPSEAEVASRLVRPRMDRTVALVRGPSVYFEILVPEENLGHMLGCVLRRYLGGSFSPRLGCPIVMVPDKRHHKLSLHIFI